MGLGLGLALVLSMTGLGIAWGLYIFSGAVSKTTLLAMSMAGAGIGAGIGPGVAWLRIDRNPRLLVALTVAVGILGGVLGGWIGYQYGANKEIECCAMPETAPFTYTAFGATIGANAAVYLLIVFREVLQKVRRSLAGAGR